MFYQKILYIFIQLLIKYLVLLKIYFQLMVLIIKQAFDDYQNTKKNKKFHIWKKSC